MSGAISLPPLYAFMAWTGKTLMRLFIMATFTKTKVYRIITEDNYQPENSVG